MSSYDIASCVKFCEGLRVTSLVQMTKWAGISLAAAASALVSGCSSLSDSLDTRPNAGPCPVAASLYDASRKVEIKGEELYSNVGFTGEIIGVSGLCRYVDDQPIDMDMEITFAFGRGPAAEGDTASYDYFVSVTRRNRAVLEKRVFPLTVTFPKGADRVTATETINKIVIPRSDETISGLNFEVLVGFDLSEDELNFNRAGKRFRVNAGQ